MSMSVLQLPWAGSLLGVDPKHCTNGLACSRPNSSNWGSVTALHWWSVIRARLASHMQGDTCTPYRQCKLVYHIHTYTNSFKVAWYKFVISCSINGPTVVNSFNIQWDSGQRWSFFIDIYNVLSIFHAAAVLTDPCSKFTIHTPHTHHACTHTKIVGCLNRAKPPPTKLCLAAQNLTQGHQVTEGVRVDCHRTSIQRKCHCGNGSWRLRWKDQGTTRWHEHLQKTSLLLMRAGTVPQRLHQWQGTRLGRSSSCTEYQNGTFPILDIKV